MSESTAKVEGLDFTVQDHASPAAEHMAKSFEHVHKAAEGVAEKFGEVTHHAAMMGLGAVGLSIGFHAIAEKVMEANGELAAASKKIAGITYAFGGWKAGISAQEKWNESVEEGRDVVEKLEESEGKLKMGRDKLSDIYKSAFALGERHNLSQERMLDMTEKLGAAEKVLGVNAEMASMIITRGVMTGKVGVRDDFSKSLRFAIGDLKAFGKLSEDKRFEKIQKAMGDLMPAAIGMGKGLSGSLFDAREAVEDFTRDLTGPVFKDATATLGTWVHKLTEVRESGQSTAKEWGGKLVTLFGYLKDTTAFIADHWKLIAGYFAATKFVGSMEGLAGKWGSAGGATHGGAGAAAGMMNVSASVVNVNGGAAAALGTSTSAAMKPGLTSVAGKLAGMAAKVGIVTESLGLLYLGLNGAAELLDKWQTGRIEKESRWGAGSALEGKQGTQAARHMEAFRDLLNGGGFQSDWRDGAAKAKEAMTAYQSAYGSDAISKAGTINQALIRQAWQEMSPETRGKQASGLGLTSAATEQQFVDKLGEMVKMLAGLLPTVEKETSHIPRKADHITNIGTVNITQDFKDRNPARIFHRTIEDVANNPTGATHRTI
jgi:hypothetical protein